MNVKAIMQYLGKCRREISELANVRGEKSVSYWFDYLWCAVRHGCLIRQYVYGEFYRLSSIDRKESMTYPRLIKVFKKLNHPDYVHLLENKRDFNVHFAPYVKREWIYIPETDFNTFCEFADRHNYVIVKPLDLCEGQGVYGLQLLKDNDKRKPVYEELSGKNIMVEQCIKQHKDMNMGGRSVNTIRMHTILDKDGNVHCFKPVFRAGVGDAVVDNYCAGGCCYEVDLELGVLITPSLSKDHIQHKIHPGTNKIVYGYQIPNWDKVIVDITNAAKMLPQCRFIGWDIAITDNGIELIEGNHNPDYEFIEFFGTRGWYAKTREWISY